MSSFYCGYTEPKAYHDSAEGSMRCIQHTHWPYDKEDQCTCFPRESVGICFYRHWFVCLSVCLSVTTITKKIVDGFVQNFMQRFLEK